VLREEYGVPISESGYYAFKSRKPSRRSERDEYLKTKIIQIYEDNYSCYGVRKVWHELLNEGERVARCTVNRLMKELGIAGAVRGKIKRTTISDASIITAEDLVNRNFNAEAPNTLWVADFTYVSTWAGWCYVALVVDVFARRIVGYRVSTRMDKKMVASAFEVNPKSWTENVKQEGFFNAKNN
jgi:putative transposase